MKTISNILEALSNTRSIFPPIDVRLVAKMNNIEIVESSFDSANISALLVFKDGKYFIGVNETHSESRKRFSIAHELGHFFLHKNMFHLDAEPSEGFIMYRDEVSRNGIDSKEIEANNFAASLLMPEKLFLEEASKPGSSLEKIAQTFNVSPQAASLRCRKLNVVLNG